MRAYLHTYLRTYICLLVCFTHTYTLSLAVQAASRRLDLESRRPRRERDLDLPESFPKKQKTSDSSLQHSDVRSNLLSLASTSCVMCELYMSAASSVQNSFARWG